MNQLPEKIGKYPIVGIDGKGNMEIVHASCDLFADRDAAIKVNTAAVPAAGHREHPARKIFFPAVHTAAALDHPNIIKVLDAGEQQPCGFPYTALQFSRM